MQILSNEGLFLIQDYDNVNFFIEEEIVSKRENLEDVESISINVETQEIKEKEGKKIEKEYYIRKASHDMKLNSIIFKGSKDNCINALKKIYEAVDKEDFSINLM
jgi:undecaprenyl pyrophosphate synthase